MYSERIHIYKFCGTHVWRNNRNDRVNNALALINAALERIQRFSSISYLHLAGGWRVVNYYYVIDRARYNARAKFPAAVYLPHTRTLSTRPKRNDPLCRAVRQPDASKRMRHETAGLGSK